MNSITGAGNSRGTGSYRPVPERAAESQQGAAQDLPFSTKAVIGLTALSLLAVNERFLAFNRCVDTDSPLSGIQDPEFFKELENAGYVKYSEDTLFRGYVATRQLVEAINDEGRDKNITEFLEENGIDTKDRFTSKQCEYTYGEVLGDMATGKIIRFCPDYRVSTTKNNTCRLLQQEAMEQAARGQSQNTT